MIKALKKSVFVMLVIFIACIAIVGVSASEDINNTVSDGSSVLNGVSTVNEVSTNSETNNINNNVTNADYSNDQVSNSISDNGKSAYSASNDEVSNLASDYVLNSDGSFNDIQTEIDSAASGSTIYLNNHTFTGNGSPIIVNKTLTIDGSTGTNSNLVSVLDAKSLSNIFNITASSVTLKNILFINGENSLYDGGAIRWFGVNGSVINSTFINNSARNTGGGAIWWDGVNGSVINSTFINNSAVPGGAICWGGVNGVVINSTFINNSAVLGGAIYWDGVNGVVINSTFINNSAVYGGAICLYFSLSGNVNTLSNNVMINCTAGENGNYIYLMGRFSPDSFIGGVNLIYLNNQTIVGKPGDVVELVATLTDDNKNNITIDSHYYNLTFLIDGIIYSACVDEGVAKLNYTIPVNASIGSKYEVTLDSATANPFKGTVYNGVIEVVGDKADTGLVLPDDVSGTPGENVSIPVSVIDKNNNSIAIDNVSVVIPVIVNGTAGSVTVDVTVVNGSADFVLPSNAVSGNVTVVYPGSDKYNSCNATVPGNFDVVGVLTPEFFNETYNVGKNFTCRFTDINGNPLVGKEIRMTLYNELGESKVYWATTNSTGYAKLLIKLIPGNWTIECSYDYNSTGDRIKANTTNCSVLVNSANAILTYANQNNTYPTLKGENFTVRLTLSDNVTPISGQTLKLRLFNALGEFKDYYSVTNATGYAKLPIYLIPANWTIECSYEPFNFYKVPMYTVDNLTCPIITY